MWHNGIQSTASQLDRGLQFADGHFTTLLVKNQQPLLWSAHWQRLEYASQQLAMGLPEQAEVLHCVQQASAELPLAVVKIIVSRGCGGRGYSPSGVTAPQWYVTSHPYVVPSAQPLRLGIAELQLGCQPLLAGLKTLNRLEQVLLAAERERRTLDELVVLDQQQRVTECVSSNLFWRVGRRWFTPQLDQAGVAGVLRQQLVQQGLLPNVQLGNFKLAHLLAAEQAFLCNSVLGFRAVASLDGQVLAVDEIPENLACWWQSNVLS